MRLTTRIHDRDAAGLTYVYPVVSRRSGGVSLGVNLNPNNACNWRCIYCQVPGLVAGRGPAIDLKLLRQELAGMLEALLRGDYMERHVPADARRLRDVAFSGNGEPTSSPDFAAAVDTVSATLDEEGLLGEVPLVLITNGSLIQKPEVQRGLERISAAGGEVWFKVDRATEAGMREVNDNRAGLGRTRENLRLALERCPTWIQTCVFARNGEPPSSAEVEAYLELAEELSRLETRPRGVLLYGIARRSYQPEAPELSPLPEAWMEAFAARIEERGLPVRLTL